MAVVLPCVFIQQYNCWMISAKVITAVALPCVSTNGRRWTRNGFPELKLSLTKLIGRVDSSKTTQ